MTKRPEQLRARASRHARGAAAFVKRLINRAMRRAARRDPEGAPTRKRYLGVW